MSNMRVSVNGVLKDIADVRVAVGGYIKKGDTLLESVAQIVKKAWDSYTPKSYSYIMFDKRVDGWYYYAMAAGEEIVKTIPKADIDEAIDNGYTRIYGAIYSSSSTDGIYHLNHGAYCYIRAHFPSSGDYPTGYYFYKEWDSEWFLSTSTFDATASGTISLIRNGERADGIDVYMRNNSSEVLCALLQSTAGNYAFWRVSASLQFI